MIAVPLTGHESRNYVDTPDWLYSRTGGMLCLLLTWQDVMQAHLHPCLDKQHHCCGLIMRLRADSGRRACR